MIVALINELLRRQANFSTVTIGEAEAKKHGLDFNVLASLNILERGSASNQRACPTCHNETLDVTVVSSEKAYTLCSQDEMAYRDYFHPEELKQWIFNTPALLSLFQKAVGAELAQPGEVMPGLLWSLGQARVNNKSYRLFFTPTISPFDEQIFKFVGQFPQSVLLVSVSKFFSEWLPIVPLTEIIEIITPEGAVLNEEGLNSFFPLNAEITSAGVLILDQHIALQGNRLMFGRLRGGVFKHGENITPQQAHIIERLFQIRDKDNPGMTLGELADAFQTSKPAISNQIHKLTLLCTKNNVPSILHNSDGKNWGINPRLSSCRAIQARSPSFGE